MPARHALGQSEARPAHQQPPGRAGAGLQAGPFTGFSVKAYQREAGVGRVDAVALSGTFNLKGSAMLQFVLVDEVPLRATPLSAYIGPGLVLGLDDSRSIGGLAAATGLRFFRSRVEIYLELIPRLILVEDRRAETTAAVGFRIYP
ncbi:MAG: hypothetical protein JJ896_09205 [Rhodothermales bacterium]|nr:hypothetical protein [Rhodothermales bacterium]